MNWPSIHGCAVERLHRRSCCSAVLLPAVSAPLLRWCWVFLLGPSLLPNLIHSLSAAAAAAAMSPSLLLLPSSTTTCRRLLPPPSRCFASSSRASFPLRPRHRIRLVCAAEQPNGAASPGSGSGGDATANPTNNGLPKNRRDILLEYVKNVQPEFMELFIKRAPAQVVEAMRQTVTNMMGTLPPQFFAVTVSTVAENLAQLMYSVLMTGYMFRNAQYRLELQQSLEQIALPEPKEEKDSPDYAPGTQKKVTGEVIRWNKATGPEKIDAVKYIELLEAEIDELSRQVARKSSQGSNELLEYLKSLEPQNLKELTSTAGEDVVFAMNAFIKRLLAVSDPEQMKTTVSETSANQLANVLFWLMIVGYSMRNIEVRFDMERVLGAPPKVAELPPGPGESI